MRILHIITRLIVGGAQENTLLTCDGLHANGHEVILLTGPSEGPEGSLMKRAEGIGYRVMTSPHLVRNPHPLHDVLAWRDIQRVIRDLKPDVVHTHSSKAGIIGRGAAWKIKRKLRSPAVIHTIHGLPFHPYQGAMTNKLWITLEAWAARRCDAIICVADAMTKQALAVGVGKPDLFTTVYSGMDVTPFIQPSTTKNSVRQQYQIPPTAFVFATVARLQPLKGHDDLLANFGTLLEKIPDAHLLWIGDGVYRPRFEQTLRDKGWSSRVTMTGLVPPTQVPAILPAADALVHPSYREGLARALPQGLLAGVPVVSYDCDGAGEVCIDGKTGFLVRTGDASALCTAMARLAADPRAAAQMGFTGREMCLHRFDWRVMVQQIESVYHRVLTNSRSVP